MTEIQAQEWAKSFENKSLDELRGLALPLGLGHSSGQRWRRARDAAIAALEAAQRVGNTDSINISGNSAEAIAEDDIENDDALFDEDAPHIDPSEAEAGTIRAAERQARDAQIDNLRARLSSAIARNNAPLSLPEPVAPNAVELAFPVGDAAQLLEHQLAASAALIGHLANYVARTDTSPEVCANFMDRMSAMIGKSAQAGKVIGQLRGHVSRSSQEISVNHGGRGRGAG